MKISFMPIFVATATACLSLASTAVANDDVMGKWFVVQEIGGLPQPTWLTVKSLEHGKSGAASINYSKPRECSFAFEYGGFVSGSHIFYYEGSNGFNFCQENYQKKPTLKLKISSDGNLIYEMSTSTQVIERGLLKRGGN